MELPLNGIGKTMEGTGSVSRDSEYQEFGFEHANFELPMRHLSGGAE